MIRRSGLERGKPLGRGKPLERGRPLERGTSELARTGPPERHTKLKAESAKHRQGRAGHDVIREAVFFRDGYRCVLADRPETGKCHGPLTPHHVKKDGQGGSYSMENLRSLCVYHNDTWVEEHPLEAEALGLWVHAWEPEPTAPGGCLSSQGAIDMRT